MNLAYAAGFIDGEGCIGFTTCRGSFAPRVIITNTQKEILEDFVMEFGGSVHKATRPKNKLHWKTAYHYYATHVTAINLLSRVSDYLKLKTEQANCLFAFDAIRPGKGYSWSEDGKEAVELIKEYLHWLNFKGNGRPEKSPIDVVLEALSKAGKGKKKKKK